MTEAEKVIAFLREKHLHIATAESCTGGLIAAAITDIPGASEVFECGIVSYSDRIKSRLLGVKDGTLLRETAVSFDTAGEMARGAAESAGAEIAVATTGYAGPGGGDKGKPVGTVYIAVYISGMGTENGCHISECHFQGSRPEVRSAAVSRAFSELCRLLSL